MSKIKTTETFVTPFSKRYWQLAVSELYSVKMLAIAAIFIALRIAIASFYIPIPGIGTNRIYFSFFVNSLGSMIYGPVVGAIAVMASDLIGFMIHPSSTFFFGYTITSMAGSFLYGLFLYRQKLTVTRIFLCKLTVNVICNVLLNGLWDSILIEKAYIVLVSGRIVKNVVMLPIETVLLYVFYTCLIPILKSQRLLEFSPFEKYIHIFSSKGKDKTQKAKEAPAEA